MSLELHSSRTESISSLTRLRKGLLFAELSMLAYWSEREVTLCANEIGFTSVTFVEKDGAQAYIFENDNDAVVACRGTEPNDWNDIKADAYAVSVVAETIGRVHRGFKKEVDDLWPILEKALVSNEKTLWFAGHSLGGAMATIGAGRCLLSHIPSVPAELHTFGSPRVGNKRYINYTDIKYYRWVNNNDIVTRMPPTWLGYRHTGVEMYFDYRGRLANHNGWNRVKDLWTGFIRAVKLGKVDHFSDHLIDSYIQYLSKAVNEEKEFL